VRCNHTEREQNHGRGRPSEVPHNGHIHKLHTNTHTHTHTHKHTHLHFLLELDLGKQLLLALLLL
jgi:hypothetical protein